MDWTFLVPLLDLPFPIYNVLRMALEENSERLKQINFIEQLVSCHGFSSGSFSKNSVVRMSNNDFARRLEVVRSFFGETVSTVDVYLKNENDTCLKLEWNWTFNLDTYFMYWNPIQSPDGWSWRRFEGDYYQARAAFMDKFQSMLNSL